MVTQVVGRVNGTGLTSIWKSSSLGKNIIEQNKYYAEMKPFIKEETAFLYSSEYNFIAAGNHFLQSATESRSHAVNYFIYMDEKEKKQFQSNVSIDFERAKTLGDESVAEHDGTIGFLEEDSQKVKKNPTFSEREKRLLMELMCHVNNGVPVNIVCDKKKEIELFKNLIQLFPAFEIGLNVNLGTSIPIAVNSKIGDCMELEMKSGRGGSVDIPEEISNVLENMDEAIAFWHKVENLPDREEITEVELLDIAKERLEEKEWESLDIQKMVWPIDKPTEDDALTMLQTLKSVYFSCESFKQGEEKFNLLQDLYKRELARMIDAQAIKPMRDKKYLALALIVCFKISPYQQYIQQKNVEKYIPTCIYKSEVEDFLDENNVGKIGIMTIWKEIEKFIISSVIEE